MKFLKICLFEQVLVLSFQNNVSWVQISIFLVHLQMLPFLYHNHVYFLLELSHFKKFEFEKYWEEKTQKNHS